MRLRLDLSYDGAGFSGWATQPELRTVQQTVEEALARVLRLPAAPRLVVAGRTDAGVHALGQVAHLDLDGPVQELSQLARRLNGVLPDDVRVRGAQPAPPGFDARFSALARRYGYRVTDTVPNPLRRGDTLAWPRPLRAEAMAEAGAALLGEHDFAPYCKRREGASTIRRLLRLGVERDPAGVVEVTVEADAFCHSMVRSLSGALLAVGEGRKPVGWPAEVLATGVRNSAVPVAPAHGLTLHEVRYPPENELAARAVQTRRRREPGP